MKKIAIIIEGSLTNRKGLVNAELSRIKYLKEFSDCKIDVYSLQIYEGWLVRKLRRSKKIILQNTLVVEEINIKLLWESFSLLNYITEIKLRYKRIYNRFWFRKYLPLFDSYDLVSAHSGDCGEIALEIYKKYKIPYCVTWHGSDIHTSPFNNKYVKQKTINILENAYQNFFVSDNLKEVSEILIKKKNKELLYNGVSEIFKQYSYESREEFRKQLDVSGKKVIAFVGGLVGIKNILLLPEIFNVIKNKCDKNIEFWIIGDGKLKEPLKKKLDEYKITNYKLWGNQPVEKMPEFMNVIDVLVLPSKNEGLPLVTIEALACGANVVGSNVGGISEAIGKENVFDLNENFVENISNRIIEMLEGNITQNLDSKFSWKETAKKENEIYNQFFEL